MTKAKKERIWLSEAPAAFLPFLIGQHRQERVKEETARLG
jgi:hypothetical protein